MLKSKFLWFFFSRPQLDFVVIHVFDALGLRHKVQPAASDILISPSFTL